MAAKRQADFVAAIVIGTTYSRLAYTSYKNEDPTKVSMHLWSEPGITDKDSTCILIRPDGKTLEAFGYEAESRYSELSKDGEHKKWYFFHRFKAALWNKFIHPYAEIEDECGRKLPNLTVFSLSIRFMKDTAMKRLERYWGTRAEDVHWVLTVPVSWNDTAKQFMRLAAVKAGIPSEMLTIALEPEAAYMFCSHHPTLKCESRLKEGNKCLVLDAGGGTIDMTVYQFCADGGMKMIHKASCGKCGGTKVDEEFVDFLCVCIDIDVIKRLKDYSIEDYFQYLRFFERAKGLSGGNKCTVRIPSTLNDIANDLTGMSFNVCLQTTRHGQQIAVWFDKLRIDTDVMTSFFTSSIHHIIEHVSCLLRKPECTGVAKLFMVGGYSESLLLQKTIRDRFPQLKIVVPKDATLAVLLGAAIYGVVEPVSK